MANKNNKQKSAERARQQAAEMRAAVEASQGEKTVEEAPVSAEQTAAEKEAARQKRIEERQADIAKRQKAAEKERKKAEEAARKKARKSGNDLEEFRKEKPVEKKPNVLRRFINWLKAVKNELKRVTWPSKQEVLKMSIVVVIALVFFGVLFFAIDSALNPLLLWFGKLGS